MVITKLSGGLGNQMFQYALSRSLSLKNKTGLLLDLDYYKLDSRHGGYQLNNFTIKGKIATKEEISKFRVINTHSLPFIWRLAQKLAKNHVFEHNHSFSKDILDLSDNTYLDGYWQSEKYFLDYKDIIRQDFTLKDKPAGVNKRLLDEINKVDSVSIHIRRGDYLTNKDASKYHGVCSIDYYEKGIKQIVKEIKSPHFFVFSDDITWAKENLKIDYPTTFIDHNSDVPWEDLQLMSKCKYFIIANSTFSWWGAWLSTYKNKIVIAPKKWILNETIDVKDKIPSNWVRI